MGTWETADGICLSWWKKPYKQEVKMTLAVFDTGDLSPVCYTVFIKQIQSYI